MSIAIGLMGFGRIGRNMLRIIEADTRFRLAAICEVAAPEASLYLLRYDTLLGRYPGNARLDHGELVTDLTRAAFLPARDPGDADWKALGVDIVIEAIGRGRSRQELMRHLERGARGVVLCSPPLDQPDASIIYGINHGILTERDRIVSNASCTAHAVAPVLATWHQTFGIERAHLSIVHAYSSVGRLADVPAGELRLSRAAAENIIPAHTHVAGLLESVLPELAGRLQASTLQVPVDNGSLVDLTVWLERPATIDALNGAIREAAAGRFLGLLEYSSDPIVSSDVKQTRYSGSYDSLATMMLGTQMAKGLVWFDNSYGYAHRALDLAGCLMAGSDRRNG